MNDDELGRLLGGALDAQSRVHVPDERPVPAPRYALLPAAPGRSHVRWLAPLAAAAAVVAVVLGVLAVSSGRGERQRFAAGDLRLSAPLTPPASSASRAADGVVPAAPGAAPVRVSTADVTDGATYGVGIPVTVKLSRMITDARSFQAATTVTVDGRPATAAWFFTRSAADPAFPLLGRLRPRTYWPAHAAVQVTVRAGGVSAGTGLGFADDVSVGFRTGARQIVTVDDTTHRLTVRTDGAPTANFPVSLGSAVTRTTRGIKVVMRKGRDISMTGPGYSDPHVEYTQQLTYSGEYLHAAPWNGANIQAGVDTSNGCTNLLTKDARALFTQLRVGDVVTYPNADGATMQVDEGFGDWNVPWSTWLRGGLVPTR